MDKPNSILNKSVFFIICLLIIFTPMARASVHLWAKTLIQIFAFAGVIILIFEKTISNKQPSDRGKTDIPMSVFYILFAMVIITTGSAFFSSHPSLSLEGIIMLLAYLAIYYMTIESVNTRKKQRILVYVIVSTAVLLSVIGLIKRFDMSTFPFWAYEDISWPGPGTFVIAYPAYQTPGHPVLSIHAHNDYLQFIADTGIFIFLVLLWGLFFLFKTGFLKLKSQSRQTRGLTLGTMSAVFAIAIHSLSDFNLHIPANIILFTVLAGTLTRQRVLVQWSRRYSLAKKTNYMEKAKNAY